MSALQIGLLLVLTVRTECRLFGKDSPVEGLDKNTPFMYRALAYLSHHFPLREDGTVMSWGRNSTSDQRETAMYELPPNVTYPHGIFWRDYNYQGVSGGNNGEFDLQLFSDYLSVNNAHRVTEYAGDAVIDAYRTVANHLPTFSFSCSGKSQDYLDTRIVQMYPEPGLPFEIPCYSCSRNQSGLLTSFHEIPARDMVPSYGKHRFENRVEKEDFKEPGFQVPYLAHFQQILNAKLKVHGGSRLIQHVGRGHGGHVTSKQLDDEKGRLQVHPPFNIFEKEAKAKTDKHLDSLFGDGLTVQCAQSLDNVPLSTGVLVNVDMVTNSDSSKRYRFDQYEEWDNSWKPIESKKHNLKLDISWDDWSCCSACCCSSDMCGIFATAKKCESVPSMKTRKGYLSFMKLDPKKKVDVFKNLKAEDFNAKLSRILDTSPYKEKGIPVYSSFVTNLDRQDMVEALNSLTSQHLARNNVNPADYKGVGMYVDTKSCQDDPQKKDCRLLAKCKGIHIEEPEEEAEFEAAVDPCDGEELMVLTLTEKKNYFKVDEGKSYRLRVDASVFDVPKGTTVGWKVSLRTVKAYDQLRKCPDQVRAVHPNGQDLLITQLSKKDTERRIEAVLRGGIRVVAVFTNSQEHGSMGIKSTTVVIWGCVIVGFLILLITFIVIVDKMRIHRAATILENKRKREDVESADVTATEQEAPQTALEVIKAP